MNAIQAVNHNIMFDSGKCLVKDGVVLTSKQESLAYWEELCAVSVTEIPTGEAVVWVDAPVEPEPTTEPSEQ